MQPSGAGKCRWNISAPRTRGAALCQCQPQQCAWHKLLLLPGGTPGEGDTQNPPSSLSSAWGNSSVPAGTAQSLQAQLSPCTPEPSWGPAGAHFHPWAIPAGASPPSTQATSSSLEGGSSEQVPLARAGVTTRETEHPLQQVPISKSLDFAAVPVPSYKHCWLTSSSSSQGINTEGVGGSPAPAFCVSWTSVSTSTSALLTLTAATSALTGTLRQILGNGKQVLHPQPLLLQKTTIPQHFIAPRFIFLLL